jgi:glycosyltransferase involved in cell wall biosynthesis
MKLLMVAPDLDRTRGGPAPVCIEAAELMGRQGHEVRIVTSDRGLPPEYRRARSPETAFETSWRPGVVVEAFPLDRPHFWGTSWAMRRRLQTLIPEADILHIHALYLFHDWVAGAICRRWNKPYIVQPHGSLDPFIYRRHRWRKTIIDIAFQNDMLRRAAGIHYTAADERDLARPHARNPRGWVVPNGIDLAAYDPLPPRSALRERYPLIGDRKVILFFGRLNFKKGVDTTIAAFGAVARERDDVFLLLAGPDGGLLQSAKEWVDAAGISDRVLFTGMVTGEEKRIVLSGSDIFVLPSQSENFGIAVVEAAACGMPVVNSDRVNLWRDFHDAQAALVAPPEATAFAVHLRRLLDHPAETAAMARRGADFARASFTWDALAPRYEAMYREAIAFNSRHTASE